MMQISVYGKGGIGKSTISSNISFALAEKGKKVVQIGCDPKHDSTRSLLGGHSQVTVLDYISKTAPYDRKLNDIILEGKLGILCAEAGGPEPGVGCAGRGILSTFDTLKKLGLDDKDVDFALYDVLGDVVCGGFAVPLRNEYSDCVFLVTSGEFMSLYAANNILKGIMNFDKGIPKVAGLIFNSRGEDSEKDMVMKFAKATGLKVIETIPRDRKFAEAEAESMTVCEKFPKSDISSCFENIADVIIKIKDGTFGLRHPHPLDDKQMTALARGEDIGYNEKVSEEGIRHLSCRKRSDKVVLRDSTILHSCAAAGAVNGCFSVSDAVTIIHGPKSCAQIIMNGKRGTEIVRVFDPNDPPPVQSERVTCTCMDDTASVFGGSGLLERKIKDCINEGEKNIFVVTTCASGIIGDDSVNVADRIMREHPDVKVMVVEADGNIAGDWAEGYVESAKVLSQYIDPDVKPLDDHINLIAERYHFRHEEDVDKEVMSLFEPFGLKVNCRFMCECDTESMKNMKRGKRSFLFSNDKSAKMVGELLNKKGIRTESIKMPSGMREVREWTEMMMSEYGRCEEASSYLEKKESSYRALIDECRRHSNGSKVLICQRLSESIDWLLELMEDLGIEVSAVLRARPLRGRTHAESIYKERYRFEKDLDDSQIRDIVKASDADFVLIDFNMPIEIDKPYTMYSSPGIGTTKICRYAERFSRMTQQPAKLGWRCAE